MLVLWPALVPVVGLEPVPIPDALVADTLRCHLL